MREKKYLIAFTFFTFSLFYYNLKRLQSVFFTGFWNKATSFKLKQKKEKQKLILFTKTLLIQKLYIILNNSFRYISNYNRLRNCKYFLRNYSIAVKEILINFVKKNAHLKKKLIYVLIKGFKNTIKNAYSINNIQVYIIVKL